MLQKFLLIGVGGSGGKTLRYVWRELDRRLNAADWHEGMPAGWQFLHIDVPEIVDVIEGDVPSDVGESHRYLGLAEAPQEYSHYDRALISRPEALPAIAGWRPDPTLEYTSPYLGAGQRRAVGKVITLTQLDRVKASVQGSVRALTSGDATDQMQRLGRMLGADPNKRRPDPAVAIVISSMGGGAGSGAFLDVIETLRANAAQGAQWLDRSLMTVLYAADVFSDLDEEQRTGIEPNTLAALAELLSASEHEGPVADIEQNLVSLGGGSATIKGRRTGRHTYIIGNKNESVTLESSRHVFRSVGKAIATFMVDDEVQHELNTYLNTNTAGRPCAQDFLLAANGRCSSLGYASVTLGRSLFADYATERLAKRSLDRLLRGYREGVEDAHLRSDKALIAEQVEHARTTFFEASGLWELGGDHNQVIDALRDKSEIGPLITGVVNDVRESLRGSKKLAPSQWKESIRSQFRDRARDFDSTTKPILEERAQKWSRDVQRDVSEATARFAGLKGLDVTIGLIVALNEQVLEAASELKQERDRLISEGSDALSNFKYLFDNLVEKVIGSSHDKLNTAVEHQRKSLQRRFEASVCDLAADLLEEISTGLLENLQKALRKARADLATSELSSEFSDLVEQWAVGEVPAHLVAAPNEVLLEKQSGVPSQLERLFDALVDGAGAAAGESAAIEEVVSGAWPSRFKDTASGSGQSLITAKATWIPVKAEARAATDAPRDAQFRVELTPATLERAAAKWVRERRGPLSDYVAETLADWLQENKSDAASRADAFADAIEQALDRSAPLISISPDAHTAVHGDLPPHPALIISEIPIGSDHRAAKRVIAALDAAGVDEARAKRLLNGNSKARDVGISTFAGRYVHPIVFDSVTGPINDQWRMCSDQPQRNDFWSFRRARTLPAFAPLAPSRQRALVRGWLTAEVLGYVDRLTGAWSDSPLSIWTPRGRRSFPRWLLGRDVADHGSVLPALIESMPLALVTFTGDESDSIQAYFRLIELGSSPAGVADSTRANAELAGWILEGKPAEADPGFESAPPPRAGSADDTPDERRDAILKAFSTYEDAYRTNIGGKRITPETTLTVGSSWEIHQVVSSAAHELITATRAIDTRAIDDDETVIPLPQ